MAEQETQTPGTLRWFVGIPIVTNPMMSLDVLTAAILVFGGALIFIVAGQHIIGDGISRAALLASAAYAAYLAIAVIIVFLVMGLVILNNRYTALYRIDHRGVYCETMRGGKPAGKGGGFLAFKPFPVEPMSPAKSGPRLLDWEDIHGMQSVDSMRAILLKGRKGGTAMKVYCPDEKTFLEAQAAVRTHLHVTA